MVTVGRLQQQSKKLLILFGSVFALSGCAGDFRLQIKRQSAELGAAAIVDPLFVGNVAFWKLDELSGATDVIDSSGVQNDGIASGSIVLGVPGRSAGKTAALFDGISDPHVLVPNVPEYDAQYMTVSGWFRTTMTGTGLILNGDNNLTAAQRKFQFRVSSSKMSCIYFFDNTGSVVSVNVVSTINVNDGLWHHAVCTYDGSAIRLYIDGVLDAFIAEARPLNSVNPTLQIGRYWSSPHAYLGEAAELGVWNRALSDAEVTELYSR